MLLEKLKLDYPIFDRRFDFTTDELTNIETTARIIKLVNEIIDILNNWNTNLEQYEKIANITNNRKLSPTGNFTGTLMGRLVSMVLASVDDSAQKIVYLANQFEDGQTGLVIDGGFFEADAIDKNYNGGIF